MSIKLYGIAQSTCTQRVLTTLIEKGLKYELVFVNLATGETKTPQFLEEKQPFGVIPILVDTDGFQVYESRAICRYLEAKYKGQGTELIPSKDAAAIGRFEQGASTETSYYDPSASGIVFERAFKKAKGLGESDEARVASLKEQLASKLDVYDKILAKQPYIGGQEFTLADLFHIPYGNLLVKVGEGALFDSRPNVKKWWDKITSRPAWKAVLELQ